MTADDLSGQWTGIFNYPAGQPPTGFAATLHDAGGALTGTTVEPSLEGGDIAARIDGHREGMAVGFVKLYEQDSEIYDDVTYAGTVSADGLEITGRWSIPGNWSGTFIMVRDAGVAASDALTMAASAEEPAFTPPARVAD